MKRVFLAGMVVFAALSVLVPLTGFAEDCKDTFPAKVSTNCRSHDGDCGQGKICVRRTYFDEQQEVEKEECTCAPSNNDAPPVNGLDLLTGTATH